MLRNAFLVAAAMLVCCGPLASGRLSGTKPPPGKHGKSMLDDWLNPKYLPVKLTKQLRDFMSLCLRIWSGEVPRANVTGIRQECRTLDVGSRDRLFQCFKRLAVSGRMVVFEAAHRSTVAPNAHGGACFPPWHHLFLDLVEIALQTHCDDPTIFLCYWDFTLDNQLPRPCDSAFFTETYVGNENGPVRTGPYANKQCLPDCYFTNRLNPELVRQCGASFRLSTDDEIESILNAISYGVLTEMDENNLTMIEAIHGLNHMFIGGQMQYITCSPCDCIFFLFHTFIDMCAYENLRLRNANIDQEYPSDSSVPPAHRANVPIQPFNIRTCIEELRPRPSYTPYAPRVIQCNGHDDCGGRALWCNGGRCTASVRGGAPMEEGWPDRACYIEGCANPGNRNGTCACE